MTTANPEDVAAPAITTAKQPLGSGIAAGWRSVREALDKPLASYYLLLGSSALLLTIGVIMVLSASSVRSYVIYDDSYAVVKRQLMWVALGLPAAWVASRLPVRHIRRLAYPGFIVALVLLGLVAQFGVLDQRQQELAGPRAGQHPARRDRQARDRDLGRQHLCPQGAPAHATSTTCWCPSCPACWRSSGSSSSVATSARRWCSASSCSGCCGWSAPRCGSSP